MDSKEFPKTWKCPRCGSEERLTQVADRVLHNGKVRETALKTVVGNLSLPSDIVPKVFAIHYDICWQCGTEYVFKAEIPQVQVQPEPQKPRMGNSFMRN